tara:strand:+ start:277 stop:420 length:144 start_codon:yes stop_codon:yes gene_type:complete
MEEQHHLLTQEITLVQAEVVQELLVVQEALMVEMVGMEQQTILQDLQ